jgi:hypothetical protein
MQLNSNRIFKVYSRLTFIAILVLPILLYFTPLDWLNQQNTICLIKNLLKIDCYGCGITKAVISGVQLDFQGAINYNKMVVIVLPLLIYTWLKTTISLYKKTLLLTSLSQAQS